MNNSSISSSINQINTAANERVGEGGAGGEENLSITTKAILLMVLGLIGKCVVSGFYNLAYIYTSAIYPTTKRNTAIIFLTCFGGLSSLMAPQINLLKTLVWNPLPYIIYSVCAFLACLCLIKLPGKLKESTE